MYDGFFDFIVMLIIYILQLWVDCMSYFAGSQSSVKMLAVDFG